MRPSKLRLPESTAATDRSPSCTASETPGSSGPELPMQVVQPNPTRSKPRVAEGLDQPGPLVVVHDHPRPGGERGLHPRLGAQPPGDGLLGQQAGGQHHLRVRRVGAAGDGGDHDVAVGDLGGRPRRLASTARAGRGGARRPSAPSERRSRLPSPSDTRSWGRDGPARLGTTVERSSSTSLGEPGSALVGVVEQALLLGVGLDQGDVRRRRAR